MGMTLKKKQSLQRKAETSKRELEELEISQVSAQRLVDNLGFHERMTAQANRIRSSELATMVAKKEQLEQKMRELSIYENEQAFRQQYFQAAY